MVLISHRGNLDRKVPHLENYPDHVLSVAQDWDVEIDVWHVYGEYFLGHDEPTYKVNLDFLRNPRFWCHAKNELALQSLIQIPGIHVFSINRDPITLTSQGWLWVGPESKTFLDKRCVMVLPERSERSMDSVRQAGAICSDVILFYKDFLKCNTNLSF